ncbi:hypothetical protein GCM10028862_09460 [Luteimonas pelagia]
MTIHRTHLAAAVVAALALAAAPAFAGGPGKGKGKDKHHDHHPAAAVHHAPGNSPKAHGRHDNGLHLGWYKQQWRKGDRIPVDYLESRYYIDDYRVYDLAPPPSGYRWVRPMDGRYLLVQTATGLILDALGY